MKDPTVFHYDLDDIPTAEAAIRLAHEVVDGMVGGGYNELAIKGNSVVLAGIAQATIKAFRAGYTAASTGERTLQ